MELLTPDYGLMVWMLFLVLPVLALWIMALVNIARNDFRNSSDKTLWLIIVILFPMIGSLLYFAIGRKQTVKHIQ